MESSYENWNGGAAYPRIIGTEGPKVGGADFFVTPDLWRRII